MHWPRERAKRDALVRAGIPLVLLVPSGEVPPVRLAVGEDWIRVPADERDLFVRAERVRRQLEQLAASVPTIDGAGRLHHGGRTVDLSASEAAVVERLLESPGAVVPRDELERRVWPEGPPSGRALDALVYRVRRRVLDLGVIISSSRGRGFLLDSGAAR